MKTYGSRRNDWKTKFRKSIMKFINILRCSWLITAKCIIATLLLLPNTDRLQQLEDYVRGCTWQLTKVKSIYNFHELLFDIGESTLNVWTQRFITVRSDIVRWTNNNYFLCSGLQCVMMKEKTRNGCAVIVSIVASVWFFVIATFPFSILSIIILVSRASLRLSSRLC